MALASDHLIVTLDDRDGVPRTFADGDITAVDIGLRYEQIEITAGTSEQANFVQGELSVPVMLYGFLTLTPNTGTHPVLSGVFASGNAVTMVVQVGNNAPPTTGDPEFSGEFYVENYVPTIQPNQAIAFSAKLVPADAAAPSWRTVA